MKKRVLIDIKIECAPPHFCRVGLSLERQAQKTEQWVKEFHEFIRDHRSHDPATLEVKRVYQDQCVYCGYEWEVDDTGMPLCCGKAIVEWEETQDKGVPEENRQRCGPVGPGGG